MKYNWLDEMTFSPDSVSTYLLRKGWVRERIAPKHSSLWAKDKRHVIVPEDINFMDYRKRMYEVVSELVEIEQRRPGAVIDDIKLS